MVMEKPRLLYKVEHQRQPYVRRFMWLLLALVATVAAYLALTFATGRGDSVPGLLAVGTAMALIVGGLLFIRVVWNLYRALTTRTETIRIFDRGFTWERKGEVHKYSWMQVRTLKQGARAFRLFGRPVMWRGTHTLITRDDKTFKFGARQGDPDRFLLAISPQIADVTGTAMGRALRADKAVRVHPALVLRSKGLVVKEQAIPWTRADVIAKGNTVEIRQLEKGGEFKRIKRLKAHEFENLPGFLDIAESAIRNHQPKRFNIKVQGAGYG